jgi:hypothetical protein
MLERAARWLMGSWHHHRFKARWRIVEIAFGSLLMQKIHCWSRGWRQAPRAGSFGLWILVPGAGRVSSGARRQREYIYPSVLISAAATVKGIGFLKGFEAISCLEFKGSSLRYSLVFVTHFFHLVITYHWISWSREEIGKRVEIGSFYFLVTFVGESHL